MILEELCARINPITKSSGRVKHKATKAIEKLNLIDYIVNDSTDIDIEYIPEIVW